ncbi:long-chain-fatty-acid--CoA ligase [Corynebacterium aquatimens]|uniref:Long-chain acyl-CoA synthetase n=1 Tax=Corynebacterium aquatimens TaxID=1190508 RepID=A0A931GSX5_9CORY|nr:long-chain-fatty-acid--CoA ligase [Corynebacterium aquatimens]MBG6122472.1 long-chain acyl-CoA synthetase [Corynebacterium aquatimens]WJY64988.1 Long-chain-fatty-acid--CoA ligase [Corynebacterium aquatimens]
MSAFEERAWLKHYAEWTPHEVELGDDTLVDIYKETLSKKAHKNATWFFGRTMTYAELDKMVNSAAAGLKAFGVRKGDRVALVMPNCPQMVISFMATLKLGASVVCHNPLYTEHELRYQFNDHGARVAIMWNKAAGNLIGLKKDTPLETIVAVDMTKMMPKYMELALKYVPLKKLRESRDKLSGKAPDTIAFETLLSPAIGGDGHDLGWPDITQDDTAVILYTSGTTGEPKGAQITHGNFNHQMKAGKAWAPDLGQVDEKIFAVLPLFHVYGLALNLGLGIMVGGEITLLPAPEPDLIQDALKKNPPTWVPGVPTLYQRIATSAKESGKKLDSIRNSFSGASTLPVSTVEMWEEVTGGRLVEGYGLTETAPIVTANPMDGNRRPGYVGIPFPNTLVRIVDPDNPTELMPDGEAGELIVKGPQVMKGYLNKPEANEKAFVDGYFRTGDMGVMEPDGWIRLVSRIKEMIITGGFNVYPDEVENTLRDHPDIEDIAVVGRPREDGSEDVVACITLEEGAALDPEGLKDFARERLTPYKVPRTFYHFEELNRDMTGKIRRREVQQALIDRLNAGTAADGQNKDGKPEAPSEQEVEKGEKENGWSVEQAPEGTDADRDKVEDNPAEDAQ